MCWLLPHRGTRGERRAEALEGELVVLRRICLQPHCSAVTDLLEHTGDSWVIDLARARLAPAGDVGNLNLANEWARAPNKLDEVPFTDLGVVEVEHHAHAGAVDALD